MLDNGLLVLGGHWYEQRECGGAPFAKFVEASRELERTFSRRSGGHGFGGERRTLALLTMVASSTTRAFILRDEKNVPHLPKHALVTPSCSSRLWALFFATHPVVITAGGYKTNEGTLLQRVAVNMRQRDSYTCKVCETAKPAAEFSAAGLARSFFWCRTCANRKGTERRRSDPAARLASRIRMREKRSGKPTTLTVKQIRQLLIQEDPVYVMEDMVSLAKLRAEESLGIDNVAVIRLGRLLGREEGAAVPKPFSSCGLAQQPASPPFSSSLGGPSPNVI